jgi:hypothetical protein
MTIEASDSPVLTADLCQSNTGTGPIRCAIDAGWNQVAPVLPDVMIRPAGQRDGIGGGTVSRIRALSAR